MDVTRQSTTPTRTQTIPSPEQVNPADDITRYIKAYAQAKPEMAALWCLGVGFVLGWKLKPW